MLPEVTNGDHCSDLDILKLNIHMFLAVATYLDLPGTAPFHQLQTHKASASVYGATEPSVDTAAKALLDT